MDVTFLIICHGNSVKCGGSFLHMQTKTTLQLWQDKERNLCLAEVELQVDLGEVEENELFIQFVENYEQAYKYCEKHNEPGKHILVMDAYFYMWFFIFNTLPCTSVQNSKSCIKHLRCIVHICIVKEFFKKVQVGLLRKLLKQVVTSDVMHVYVPTSL